jgi:hypothetical protein
MEKARGRVKGYRNINTIFCIYAPKWPNLEEGLAESDDTRGCICTICIVDLLMMSGLRSKHVEEFDFM